jgi:glutamate N-acetyltransferase/amino-acid N-acetyltransferase
VCKKLADDIVRNGEGTNHVIQVTVKNAPSFLIARDMGRAVVNSPLFKCAIAGNDPNVGRLLAAVGKFIGNSDLDIPLDKVRSVTSGFWCTTSPLCGASFVCIDVLGYASRSSVSLVPCGCGARLSMGGQVVYGEGAFQLNPDKEALLVQHMRDAAIVGELKASATMAVVKYPPHDRNVIVEVDLGQQQGHQATVLGSDLTWDYVTENLSYRS